MQLRLTTPEAVDRLIDFLEGERDLVWPEWSGFDKTYRDVFIEIVKKNMAKDTVLLNVEWEYNAQSNRLESKVYYTIFSEIATDEEYLNEELKEKEDNIFNDNAPCLLSNDVIGFRYSPELTEKLNK